MDYLDQLYTMFFWGNSLFAYGKAVIIFIVLIICLKLFQVLVLTHLKKLALKTKTDLDDIIIEIVSSIKPPLYLIVAIYFSLKTLLLSHNVTQVLRFLFIVILIYEFIAAIERFLDYWVKHYVSTGKSKDRASESMIHALRILVRVALWTVGLLLLVSNMGFNVSSLVASLGIGGVAIALAVQSILSDMFSSFSIYLDKPFKVGDFIIIDDYMGTVKHIGLKTTRIQALRGEEIVVSNKELTSTRIRNFKKLKRRRVAADFGIEYGTSATKLENISVLTKKIIEEHKECEYERCFFKEYGDSSLVYELSYYIQSDDYEVATQLMNSINLAIYKVFEKEGIAFAFPTQTVYLRKEK